MTELMDSVTAAGVAVVFTLLMQLIALVWGAATVVSRLRALTKCLEDFRAEYRQEMKRTHERIQDMQIRVAVAEAIHDLLKDERGLTSQE